MVLSSAFCEELLSTEGGNYQHHTLSYNGRSTLVKTIP